MNTNLSTALRILVIPVNIIEIVIFGLNEWYELI